VDFVAERWADEVDFVAELRLDEAADEARFDGEPPFDWAAGFIPPVDLIVVDVVVVDDVSEVDDESVSCAAELASPSVSSDVTVSVEVVDSSVDGAWSADVDEESVALALLSVDAEAAVSGVVYSTSGPPTPYGPGRSVPNGRTPKRSSIPLSRPVGTASRKSCVSLIGSSK